MLQAGQKYSHEKTRSREHDMTEAPTKVKGKIMVHVKENFERAHKISCASFGKEIQRQHVDFGKPLVRLAALPKERYINFVDAYRHMRIGAAQQEHWPPTAVLAMLLPPAS